MGTKIYSKTVLLPINVSPNDWCWGGSEHHICQYFDNEGGHPRCDLKLSYELKYEADGSVKKPQRCLELKEDKITL